MSPSHRHATAQNVAEFAQNLVMGTPKLEKSCIFTICTCFCIFFNTFYVTFRYYLRISLRKVVKSKVLTVQENPLL